MPGPLEAGAVATQLDLDTAMRMERLGVRVAEEELRLTLVGRPSGTARTGSILVEVIGVSVRHPSQVGHRLQQWHEIVGEVPFWHALPVISRIVAFSLVPTLPGLAPFLPYQVDETVVHDEERVVAGAVPLLHVARDVVMGVIMRELQKAVVQRVVDAGVQWEGVCQHSVDLSLVEYKVDSSLVEELPILLAS